MNAASSSMPASSSPPDLVVGVDLGGTNLQAAVVDGHHAVRGRAHRPTGGEHGLDHVVAGIADLVQRACDAAACDIGDVAAIGVAAAGAIDVPHGIVLSSPNLGWWDVPLRDRLREAIGRPVVLDNDVNGAVWGEYVLGEAGGRGDALGVWVGTGLGGGLVLDGRLHHGDFFTAGELGQTVVEPDAPPGRRTLEAHASRTAIRAIVRDGLSDHPDSIARELTGGDADRLGTDEIRRAFEADDPLVVGAVDHVARHIGVAVANCVTILALGTVIVGGGITEALGAPFLARIRASFDRHVFPDRARDCRLVMTTLAADAGLLGAALLARRRPPAPPAPAERR